MLLYALFQEALYVALQNNHLIVCIDYQNREKLIVIGYADDASLFPKKLSKHYRNLLGQN